MGSNSQSKISFFSEESIAGLTLPERFTFPFYYEPHPLTKIAAAELQHYLETEFGPDHNFGLDEQQDGMAVGKMFGVLVVQTPEGRLGYLCAFSGKLAGTNDHPKFVPPVFDMLVEGSFFLKGIRRINAVNARIADIQEDEQYLRLKQNAEQLNAEALQAIASFKEQIRINRAARNKQRASAQQNNPDPESIALLEAELVRQSLYDKRRLRDLTNEWDQLLQDRQPALGAFEEELESLKNERRERSAALQEQLFEQYSFLNKDGQRKSLQDIFSQTAFGKPPSAAGECATPKLLQFAFAQGYTPVAMAEFWWGAAPKSEIRKHKKFYPACNGKCKPILAHMLEGIPVDDNPFLETGDANQTLEKVYEDDSFIVINKPSGLRSVPGIEVQDSVYTRLKHLWNGLTEPLIVHRLDMDTSGLLVVAKTSSAQVDLQKQFLKRTVRKRYTALLSKVIREEEGEIDLPLRGDPFDRPRQLVCFEDGKKSVTRWKVAERYETTTRIHFWPLTGRTHQLRMHAAHELGLHAPIVGDDLYGTSAERMYLHAACLEFVHPVTRGWMSFEVRENF